MFSSTLTDTYQDELLEIVSGYQKLLFETDL